MPTSDLSTQEAESGRSLSSRPDCSTDCVLGQPGLHRETPSRKAKWKKKKKEFYKKDKEEEEGGLSVFILETNMKEVREEVRTWRKEASAEVRRTHQPWKVSRLGRLG